MFELRIHSKACLGDKNEKQKRSTYCMHGAEARDATGSVCGSSRSSGIVNTGGVGANRLRRASACGNGAVILVWSRISNALKRLGFRSHNFLAQRLSETSRACKSMYNPGSTIKFREAL